MNRKLKMTLLAMTSVLALPLVASCGDDEIVDTGQVITIWYAFNADYEEQLNIAARALKEQYPEYIVKPTKVTGTYENLKNTVLKGFATGNYPDIVVAYPDAVAEFVEATYALNMDTYINDPEIGWTATDLDDIPEAYIKEGQEYRVSGTYSLPLCKSSEALYYNADKLIGLRLNTIDDEINNGEPLDAAYLNSLTWEELFGKLCPAIAKYDSLHPEEGLVSFKSSYIDDGAIVGYDSDDNFFITLAEQYGCEYTSVNEVTHRGSVDFVLKNEQGEFADVTPQYMEIMKMVNRAMQNHTFNDRQYRYLVTGAMLPDKTRTNNIFTSNNGGMLFSIGSTGGTMYQDASGSDKGNFDVGVAYLPHAESTPLTSEQKTIAINQGPSLAFLKRGTTKEIWKSHAKGAWLYYKALTSKEMNAKWAKATGYSPIRNSVINDPDYKEFASTEETATKKPGTKAMLDARNAQLVLANVPNLFSTAVFNGSAVVREAVKPIIADIKKHGSMPLEDLTPSDPGYDEYLAQVAAFEGVVRTYFSNAYSNAIKF